MIYKILLSPYQRNILDTQHHIKQQDYGATFKMIVEDYDTTNSTCRIVFRRADGVVRQYTLDRQADGTFEYNLSADDTYAVGKTVVDLKLYDTNKRESTASFIYYVDKDEMGEHFESGDYFDAVDKVLGDVEKAIEDANEVTDIVQGKLDRGEFEGTNWLTGSVDPTNEQGKDGDLYLNISSNDVFERVGGSWAYKVNLRGKDGVEGSVWHTAIGVPSSELGKNGDFYLNSDQDSNDVYEKVSGSWIKRTNIKGESGVYISATNDVTPPDWATVWIVADNEPTSDIEGKLFTKVDKTSVVNNFLTTEEGYVADARTVKTLKDSVDELTYTNRATNIFTPTNTGFNTLIEFIANEIVPKNLSYYSFSASSFTDLPIMAWGYTCEYINTAGAIYVRAYKHLSVNEMCVRGISADNTWLSDWKYMMFGTNPTVSTAGEMSLIEGLGGIGTQSYLRYGNLVILNMCFKANSAIDANTPICNLPFPYAGGAGNTGAVTFKGNWITTTYANNQLVLSIGMPSEDVVKLNLTYMTN